MNIQIANFFYFKLIFIKRTEEPRLWLFNQVKKKKW